MKDNIFRTNQVKNVSKYFTPLAIIIVIVGTIVAKIDAQIALISTILVILTYFFNIKTEDLASKNPKQAELLARTRLLVNFTINVVLLYMMGMYWKPIWLLFVLSPVATAVYNTTARTIVTCAITAFVLVLVYFIKGMVDVIFWGELAIYILFIFVISLFVNNLAKSIPTESK